MRHTRAPVSHKSHATLTWIQLIRVTMRPNRRVSTSAYTYKIPRTRTRGSVTGFKTRKTRCCGRWGLSCCAGPWKDTRTREEIKLMSVNSVLHLSGRFLGAFNSVAAGRSPQRLHRARPFRLQRKVPYLLSGRSPQRLHRAQQGFRGKGRKGRRRKQRPQGRLKGRLKRRPLV